MTDARNYACIMCEANGNCRVCNKPCKEVSAEICRLICKAFNLGYKYVHNK